MSISTFQTPMVKHQGNGMTWEDREPQEEPTRLRSDIRRVSHVVSLLAQLLVQWTFANFIQSELGIVMSWSRTTDVHMASIQSLDCLARTKNLQYVPRLKA